MEQVKDGWFSEKSDLWPGQCLSLEVEQVLHQEKSPYQDILVLKTKSHGVALVLDGIIQCTERDEFAYQEMITFLPLCAHRDPKRVLIVGGGDGGVAREVVKHPLVESVVQVEIDGAVVAASRRYLPFMAAGFDSPKLELRICDGFAFMREHRDAFDVIITDSSDPIGPAVDLFTAPYFGLLKGALRAGGVACSQAGTAWADLGHVALTLGHCRQHFANARYAVASVPTYPTGQIGFVVATADVDNLLDRPKHVFAADQLAAMKLRYYSGDVHRSAFVLPNFIRDVVG